MNGPAAPRSRLSRAEAKEQTRRRLLAAAADVVARRGFVGASVDEIAGTAGYTVGALYAHFDSKDQLIMAAMRAHVATQTARATAAMGSDDVSEPERRAALGQLLAGAGDPADGSGASVPLFWAELWLHAARNPEIADLLADEARAIDEIITASISRRRGAAGGDEAVLSDAALATVVSSLFRGLAQRRRIDPDAVPDELLGRAVEMLVAGRRALAEAARDSDAHRQ